MSPDPVRRPRPPSVDALLAAGRARLAGEREPEALRDAARALVDDERGRLAAGAPPRTIAELADTLAAGVDRWLEPPAAHTINATGVIVHTNLGRAPWRWAISATAAVSGVSTNPSWRKFEGWTRRTIVTEPAASGAS